jgi:uncharacterized protein YbjT (DUF2867 family)
MKILVTGANGYIGQRLIRELLMDEHEIYALVRQDTRFQYEKFSKKHPQANLHIINADLLDPNSLAVIPQDLDLAFYLVHSMSGKTTQDFEDMEKSCALNFVNSIKNSSIKQVIYLGGIANSKKLSKHLRSRVQVEEILKNQNFALTVLRAAIIIGSGSASFEIIRDLTEKLPVMLAPKWLKTKCQPIAIRNVIQYLQGVMLKEESFNQTFDIGGPEALTYTEILYSYARVRNLKRLIIPVPLFSPRLSSHWLSFITSADYSLARNLVTSLKNQVTVEKTGIEKIVPIKCFTLDEAIQKALYKVSEDDVFSSWKDAFIYTDSKNFMDIEIPEYGCLFDRQEIAFTRDKEDVIENIWNIGGTRGWYYWDWAWEIRGMLDIAFGGVGLRRGRRNTNELFQGDALDFWRVLKADRKNGYLALYAEMKLPGEAFLEFKIEENKDGQTTLKQIATFRPQGLWGRLYWYLMMPAHIFIFSGMAQNIINFVPHKKHSTTPTESYSHPTSQ